MQRKLQLDIIVKPKTDNMIIYRYKVKEILQQKSAWINVTYKNIRPKKSGTKCIWFIFNYFTNTDFFFNVLLFIYLFF